MLFHCSSSVEKTQSLHMELDTVQALRGQLEEVLSRTRDTALALDRAAKAHADYGGGPQQSLGCTLQKASGPAGGAVPSTVWKSCSETSTFNRKALQLTAKCTNGAVIVDTQSGKANKCDFNSFLMCLFSTCFSTRVCILCLLGAPVRFAIAVYCDLCSCFLVKCCYLHSLPHSFFFFSFSIIYARQHRYA